MSHYVAKVPSDGSVKAEIHNFFEQFYAISDTPNGHEKYADQFTKNAKLIMATNEANGRDEIIKMRHGMWEKVAKREHHPLQIFAFGPGSDDVMLHGNVDYELKDGKKTNIEWAARAHFSSGEGGLKMDLYQVYLVPITPSISESCNLLLMRPQDTAAVAKAK